MTRIRDLVLSGIAAGVLGLVSTAATADPISIRVGGVGPAGGADATVMTMMKDQVEAAVGADNVEFRLFPASALGSWSEMAEQVKGGGLECFYDSLGDLGALHPAANIEGVAFLYRDEDHFFRIWRGPIGQKILDKVAAEAGFRLIGPAFRGFRDMLLTVPADSLADLQGVPIRAPNIPAYIESFRAMGVSPTPIAYEETYSAIQTGVVNGIENPLVVLRDGRFYEVAKHLILTNHMAETMGFMCNEAWWQALDPAIKDAMVKAADAGADWYRKYTDENSEALITEMEGQGVIVHRPEIDPFIEQAKSAKYDPALQPFIDEIRSVE
jgi:tripartite ATP-independent transporter DctP family solute receptor